jgi:hypothetical protein
LSRKYKDLKDEVNSIKQQNSGVDRRGNMIWRFVRNVKSDFKEFVDENADAGEDDYDFASVGQRIRSGLNKARRNVNFHSMGIIKIWTRTWTSLNLKFLTFKVKMILRLIWSERKR